MEKIPAQESISDEHKNETIPLIEIGKEAVKDEIFNERMVSLLIEDYTEDLEEIVGDDDFVKSFTETLLSGDYSYEDIVATLAIPKELRERQFTELYEQAEAIGITEAVSAFVKKFSERGYGIGFHTSQFEILPNKNGNWLVAGTENDHRDSDLSRAYYSSQYRHLYKKKNPRFIYIVRTEPDTHRTDGNWSRASTLSIIAKVPFNDVVDYVEATFKEKAAAPVEETEEAA